MSVDFERVVTEALAQQMGDPADPRWPVFIDRHLGEHCSAFIEWATHHRKWQFNVADVADRICAKPREAAIAVLSDIAAEDD